MLYHGMEILLSLVINIGGGFMSRNPHAVLAQGAGCGSRTHERSRQLSLSQIVQSLVTAVIKARHSSQP